MNTSGTMAVAEAHSMLSGAAVWLEGILLQAGPPPLTLDEAQAVYGLLAALLVARLVAAPIVYLHARHKSTRESWWASLVLISPLIGGVLYLVLGSPRDKAGHSSWNPWVPCPACGAPRGWSPDPCPRCGALLPVAAQARAAPVPGYPMPPAGYGPPAQAPATPGVPPGAIAPAPPEAPPTPGVPPGGPAPAPPQAPPTPGVPPGGPAPSPPAAAPTASPTASPAAAPAAAPPAGPRPTDTSPGVSGPPETAPARWKGTDVTGAQVLGALLFVVLLTNVLATLALIPSLMGGMTPSELNDLQFSPVFVLLALVLQDSILLAVTVDQSLLQGRLTREKMGLGWRKSGHSLPWHIAVGLGAGALTFAFSAVSVDFIMQILSSAGVDLSTASVGTPDVLSFHDYLLFMPSFVVIAPVAEELFFRGYALGGFAQRGQINTGLIFTSVLFGAIHLNPLTFLSLTMAGVVLGAVYLRTGSLVAPLVAHATNNFTALTLAYLGF